jgi:hypothetical protein
MLTLVAIGLACVTTEASVQYVDHNLLQVDNLNADDHLFLESACRRFGIWYSRPSNGITAGFQGRGFSVLDRSSFRTKAAFSRCKRAEPAEHAARYRRGLRELRGPRREYETKFARLGENL